MESLRFSSLLSEAAEPFYQRVCDYLSARLEIEVEFSADLSWREREEALDRGEIHGAFVCGWHYASRLGTSRELQLCCAPVMAAERYGGRAIYFSDIIVAADSPWHSLLSLRGATVAYNDLDSHSGYNLLLERVRSESPFFGQAIEAGSHMASIALVRKGGADCASIDSTVLELASAARPELQRHLRVVETLGPSAAPPLALVGNLAAELVTKVTDEMARMHDSGEGRGVLQTGRVLRFARVTPAEYAEIAEIGARAASENLA